ncbi:MAG: cytochrome c1 [Alphaproteobacteria bacterium CG_4_9_14_3_um_filter_47_13]|nr:MAG: cytochrome c1 [Alphaproteobacteria bacterium CG_4_9_14_3_um_filter_47_13]
MRLVPVLLLSLLVFGIYTPAQAAGGEEAPEQHWSFDGIFGTYDRAALQRGYKVYSQVCAACHSMDRISYRNLTALGYTEAQAKAVAANYMVEDGPNDEGDMVERTALLSDHFPNPYANKNAAAYANNGAMPPDMSLLVKARHGGADYIYGIMTGYEEPPADHELLPGQNWNRYMPGNVIAMAQPLSDGLVSYEDGSSETVAQYARDVAHFLTWASEPHMEERKRTGIKAFLFLLAFTGLMYVIKRKVWAKVH